MEKLRDGRGDQSIDVGRETEAMLVVRGRFSRWIVLGYNKRLSILHAVSRDADHIFDNTFPRSMLRVLS